MSIEHRQLETHTQRTGLHNCVHPGIEICSNENTVKSL